MRVDVYASFAESIERRIRDTSIIVIDVLRATTTIIEAIENGVRYIIPVAAIEEAVAIRRARGGQTLLAGERDSMKIEGFDIGNSPFEFSARDVKNRVVVMSTSNGTGTILKAGNIGDTWIGSLRNREALCKKVIALGEDVSIICAGSDDAFSADDTFAAGSYISKLRETCGEIEVGDLGIVAESFYNCAKNNLGLLSSMEHYKRLCELGLHDDIEFCLKEDMSKSLAIMKDSITIINALK